MTVPEENESNYRGQHTAPGPDSPMISELDQAWPADVYEHPEWYGSGDELEAMPILLDCRNDPDHLVTIFRAVPRGVHEVNTGDWVTLSLKWARTHAMQDDNVGNDWPVVSVTVPARWLNTDGNSLAEFGYNGPNLYHCMQR